LLVEIGKRLNLTRYSLKAPEKPSQLSILLRKHLENKRLESIAQHGFDRVVVLKFADFSLILEFFSRGNMLLLDSEGKILLTFRGEEWKDRTLKKEQKYIFPKGASNPYEINLSDFKKIFTENDAVRSLVKSLSFGGDYAEEICSLAGVEKNTQKPADSDKESLFKAMKKMIESKTSPVMQDNRLFPFSLSKFDVQKKYNSMNEAIDDFYLTEQEESPKLKKLRKRLEEQISASVKFEKETEENKIKGDLIYSNYSVIENSIKNKKGKVTLDLD